MIDINLHSDQDRNHTWR